MAVIFKKCKKMIYKFVFVGGGEYNKSFEWYRQYRILCEGKIRFR